MKTQNLSKLFLVVIALGISQLAQAQTQIVQDAKLKQEAKTLFSHAVGSLLPHFYNGKISNRTLVQFGLNYASSYQYDHWQMAGNHNIRLRAKSVTQVISRYFGRGVKHVSVSDFNYRNGYYYTSDEWLEGAGTGDYVTDFVLYRGTQGRYIAYARYSDEPGVDEQILTEESKKTLRKKRLDLKRVGTGKSARFIITGWSPSK